MGYLPIRQHCPFHQKLLDFYLKLLLLLKTVMCNQSLQHCPVGTEDGGFPNFTSETGSPFFFRLPLPDTQHNYQVTLADRSSSLPHWMVFQPQTLTLAGLALTEECGIYHLKVSAPGVGCAAQFYLHILNRTVTSQKLARNAVSCPEGHITVWADLLIQQNPAALDADRRLHLVTTMADYLHLPADTVFLSSRIISASKLRVCRHNEGDEKLNVTGDVAKLLWPLGCPGEEKLDDFTVNLDNSLETRELATLLEAPVLKLRVLCVPDQIQQRTRVKRGLQTPIPISSVEAGSLDHSDLYPSSLSLPRSHEATKLVTLWNSLSQLQSSSSQVDALAASAESSFGSMSGDPIFQTLIYHTDRRSYMYHSSFGAAGTLAFLVETLSRFPSEGQTVRYQDQQSNLLPSNFHSAGTLASSLETFSWFTSEGHISQTLMYHSEINVDQQSFAQPSHFAQASTLASSLETFSWFTSGGRISQTLMYHSEINPDKQTYLLPTNFASGGTFLASLETFSGFTMHLSDRTPVLSAKTSNMQERQKSSICVDSTCVASELQPHAEITGCCAHESEVTSHVSPSDYFPTTDFSYSPFSPAHASTVPHSLRESTTELIFTKVPSSAPHSITVYPSLRLTPATYSVTSTLTHWAVDGGLWTTRLTLGPHQTESRPGSEYFRASLSDSERRPTVSSQGPSILSQESTKDHESTPSVSGPPLTEEPSDVLLLTSGLEPTQSLPSSNDNTRTTQLFPDVSPTSYLMTGQLSITQQKETVQHFFTAASGSNLDASSRLNVPTRYTSSATTPFGKLTPSGQFQLESSLTTSTLEASLLTFTPALPSELFSGQTETPHIRNSAFSAVFQTESPSAISLLQTSSLPHGYTSSLSLQSKVLTNFQSGTAAAPTLMSESLLTSLLSLQMSLFSPESPQISSVPSSTLKAQSFEVSATHERMSFMPSLKRSLVHTTHSEESQSIHRSSHIFSNPGITSSTYLNATKIKIVPTVTYLSDHSISMSATALFESHSDATAPSSVQELYPASTVHLMQSQEPSFPICDLYHVHLSGCTPSIHSTYLKNSWDQSLDLMTSFSPHETDSTVFTSQIFTLESTRFVSSTQTPSSFYLDLSFSTITYTPSLDGGLSSTRSQSSLQPSYSSTLVSESVNLPPIVLQPLPVLMATVGVPFLYSIPPETFLDPEDGEADSLSLEIRLIDGPPLSVGMWLYLDGLELHGVPLEMDLRFVPQHLYLVAQDRHGLGATLPMTLDLRRTPVEPCHVFTLTAQRSLYSILRQRHLVELLLRKLSRFFNSSSSHHLSVVSMMPGSTVVSWYNRTLCETAQAWRTRRIRCHEDEINSMWVMMKSADGSVNLAFREAMLPEFPISKVGPVSYGQGCFLTTPYTPTSGRTTPGDHTIMNPSPGANISLCPTSSLTPVTPISRETNSNSSMVGMMAALLVLCLLILITILVAVVLYFRRRGTTVTLRPAKCSDPVHGKDLLWAIEPRRPPLFQPELPPPPLRLWTTLTPEDERTLSAESNNSLQPHSSYYNV